MQKTTMRIISACAVACLVAPAAAHAGTRAGDSKTYAAPQASSSGNEAGGKGKGYETPGPKDGFKDNKGHEIAEIKADDHAAFKRYKSRGC